MTDRYIKRLAEDALKLNLSSMGCVLVTGPKFCGKSTMCAQYAKSVTELKTANAIGLAKADPRSALVGEHPHLIDEWQKVPDIWNYIKSDLDHDYVFGKYIITGSTTPVGTQQIQHSGAGRIVSMTLKPFTLYESGESLGIVSLSSLFEEDDYEFKSLFDYDNSISLNDIANLICRGGWPLASKVSNPEQAIRVTKNYYRGLFTIEDENDDFSLFLKGKNIDLLTLILKSYARNISTQAKKTKMISDIIESGNRSKLDEDTFDTYVKVLKDLFIVYDMPAWNLNLRSSVSVRTAPTHHFVDTSIATACLGINPSDLLNDLNSFGLFFEDFAIRDLSVYAESIDATIKHYRDSSGQEVDAIIELPNGKYGAIEIKLADPDNIEKGANSLKLFEKRVVASNHEAPKFKMVLTSHGSCYRREDGVCVVPISCLKN